MFISIMAFLIFDRLFMYNFGYGTNKRSGAFKQYDMAHIVQSQWISILDKFIDYLTQTDMLPLNPKIMLIEAFHLQNLKMG